MKMADLSAFKSCQIVDVRMKGANVTINDEVFGVASSVSKVMTAFEKEGKTKLRKRSESCLIGTVGLLHGLLGRITRTQLRKLL